MIYPVVGNIGSGKSIFLTCMAFLKYCSGYEIYTNFKLKGIPYKRIFDVDDFQEIQADKIAAFIDEVQLTADSRRSGSEMNILFSRNMTQSRKWGKQCDVYVASQSFFFMDVRLRTLAYKIFEPSIKDSSGKPMIDSQGRPMMLKVRYLRMDTDTRTIGSFRLPLLINGIYIPDLYDTLEILDEVGDRRLVSNVTSLIDKYHNCKPTKKGQIVSFIRFEEAKLKNYVSKEDAGIAADNILLMREI